MSEAKTPLALVLERLDKVIELLTPKEPSKKKPSRSKESISGETWLAYSAAYKDIHGEAPPRNAKINADLKRLVDKLGKDHAPKVADYYVRTYNKYYFARMHPTGVLLNEAEKLYILWQKSKNRKELVAASGEEIEGGLDKKSLDKIRKELGYIGKRK